MRANVVATGLYLVAVCLCASACGGDDDGNPDGGAGAGAGAGGSGARPDGGRPVLPGPDGGQRTDAGTDAGDVTPGEEGYPCLSQEECGEAENGQRLTCVASGFQFGICGRSCSSDDDCGAGLCVSYSTSQADAHCIDIIREEFATCGAADTSDCSAAAGLRCLYLPDLPIGVCATLCASGGGDDAGAPDGMCKSDQMCRGGIVRDNGDGIDGLCGAIVERDEPCGIFLGAFCGDGDVCAPTDPLRSDSDFVCKQDCTEAGATCDEGRCVQYRNLFGYCL